MSFYRSDSVNHFNLVIPRENAWDIMNKIGQVKLVHVVPNPAPVLTKPFFVQVKRCEESLLKLQTLQKILYDKKICQPNHSFTDEAYRQLYRLWENESATEMRLPISMLDTYEQKVTNAWKYYHDLQDRMQNLKRKMNNYRQNLAIIRSGQKKYGRAFFTNSQSRIDELGQVFMRNVAKVGYKSGILNAQDEMRFKRTIFRITKGNCLIDCIHFDDIFQDLTEQQKTKVVFFILFPAQSDNYLQRKVDKLVQMYCEQKYQLPTRPQQFQPFISSCQVGYGETQKLLSLTQQQMDQYFQLLASPSKQFKTFRVIENIKLYLTKERQLYQNLNEFDVFNNFLKGEIYVRKVDVPELQKLLQTIQKNMKIPTGQMIASEATKFPTHYVKNDYTCSAQQIVQTYGVARYQQANPAFFTTITFPFLFGVMFGDIAHGFLLFLFGLYMCFQKDQVNNFVLKMMIPHRYLLTLMGFFAFYCGWVYNQFLSVSLDIFGSCYNPQAATGGQPIPRYSNECVYAFGLDPVWSVAENNLNFVNSLKMKISVIIAVVHMTLGVFVKASNSVYYGKWLDFFFEFVPQLAFMIVLFAYMDFLIIYKWNIDWTAATIPNAPSIITTMINMPLRLGKTDDCCGGMPLWGTPGNTSQDHIQFILLMIAAVCVPMMLLPKPLYEIYCKAKHSKPALHSKQSMEYKKLLAGSEVLNQQQNEPEKEHEHDSSQIFVHQLIQTIEYVLGCISNTASYLRLWALSLAHSQLSQVFLEKTVEGGMDKGYSGIGLCIVGFPVFIGATFGVLLCMDSLQCFLHTLRLHWVEFQNKFYKGDGFPFVFYNFTDKIKVVLEKGV